MHDCKRIFQQISTALSETLWPTRCIGCELPGALLCADCRANLPYIDARAACPNCGAPYGMTDCTECARNLGQEEEPSGGAGCTGAPFPFEAARSAVSYEGVTKRLVTAYKDHDELRLAPILATLLCRALRGQVRAPVELPACQETARVADWTPWADALVPVPASPEALRRRGFDHMGRTARLVAEYTGLPCLEVLGQTRRVSDQRELGAEQRARNRSGSFALTGAAGAGAARRMPARIVLLDDVFTTGATASAAAEALLAGGAHSVRVATCARVW